MLTKSRRGEIINCDSRKTAMRKSQGKLTDLQNQTKYTNRTGKRHILLMRGSTRCHRNTIFV